MELSGTGVWSGALRYGDRGDINEAAAELEGLGYSAIWVPGARAATSSATARLSSRQPNG